ncbi:TPA: hypothetical protein QH137_000138 [Klebsiella aerogenes]|jgi:hypothetical protein|uniref:hypothetical protein n=1 Tax=Klebsiella aerogenes TaxID=548 RepID=UPI0013A62F79|nr:hypothetical protein [Klebsiella aerogenes]MBK0648044.1 hypothetical protein [Klebsiella aerogenes]UNX69930.1 hypothetical protein MQE04_08830 [Klebsiella aerogenes]HBW0090271.1 hypothetical protein [Klebsiella aerogenes]HCB3100507.1 hypothetical protein [Klebsiella aerogenes]HCH0562682.1 hypothetical protein [Klebsiella aerogenes]
MTDINRLITSLKRRSAHAKEFGHDVLFVKLEDIDALVTMLESNTSSSDSLGQPGEKEAILASGALKHP